MEPIEMPNMTSEQYRKKVEGCLMAHLDHNSIQRLRNHKPVSQVELAPLEKNACVYWCRRWWRVVC